MFPSFLPNVFFLFCSFYMFLEAGERCCSTPVQFLYCSLPLAGLSPQQGPAVQLIFFIICFNSKDKTWRRPLYSFNSNKPYVFRQPRNASLSLDKFDSIASALVHLLPPPLSSPPSSLCHFIALSRPPFLGWVERKPGEVMGGQRIKESWLDIILVVSLCKTWLCCK